MSSEILLPELAEGMEYGKVVTWLKREGDTVAAGDPVAEIETDKTTVELEAPSAGVIQSIRVAAGTEGVRVGTVLATIAAAGAAAKAPQPAKPQAAKPAPQTDAPAPREERPAASQSTGLHAVPEPDRSRQPAPVERHAHEPVEFPRPVGPQVAVNATPLAERMARLAGVDLATLAASAGGRVTRKDVERAIRPSGAVSRRQAVAGDAVERPEDIPVPSAGMSFTDQPLTAMRRVTAERLLLAKQTVPHFYLNVECRADALMQVRAAAARRSSGKLTVTDLVVFAASRALRLVPEANAAWNGNGIRVFHNIDIAVAVDTPRGLITPILRNTQSKTLGMISAELRELAERARNGQLKPAEYTGGTFTISNLGMFGVTSIVPIVNPPQSCILGVGGIESKACVTDGQLVAGSVMTCTLAADHRVIDGAGGARMLAEFRRLIEHPVDLALDV